jgi:hypothetical protein
MKMALLHHFDFDSSEIVAKLLRKAFLICRFAVKCAYFGD